MSKMASETDHGEDCVNNKPIINEPPEFTTEEINELTNKEREAVPLQTPWTFWYDSSQHGANAEEFTKNLKLIYTVNTVQGFWAVFNNIAAPDELQPHYSYHFMQDERRPLWEDEVNQNGGTWKLKCSKHKTNKVWKELLLAAIGEQFVDCMAEGDKVCGVTVTVRDKDDLIQIWNVEAALHTESTILNKISQLLPDVNFHSNFYKPHQTHHAYSGSARNYGQSGATRSLR